MAGERFLTVDQERIRKWVEARGGRPAAVPGSGRRRDPGLLRLDLPGQPEAGADAEGHAVAHITWTEWFRKFDDSGLVLLHQETLQDGRPSNLHSLIGRSTASEAARLGAQWVGRDRGEPPPGRREEEGVRPRVDINRASADELGQLFGIGPEHAHGIIRFRSRNGRIRELDELLDVEGIDGATLQGLRKRVRTE